MSGPAIPTTSGQYLYNPAATKIITRAFRIMTVIDDTESPTAEMMEDGLDGLNALVAELQATGIHVWTEEEAMLFLQQNQRRYLLGSPTGGTPSPDHCCDANSWTMTTLAQSASAGDTSVIVTSPSGILAGDKFGVVTNNGNAFWTTVKSAAVGNVVPLTDPLTVASNAGNFCFDYTKDIVRPLRVPVARRLALNVPPAGVGAPDWGGIITPLTPMMSRQEYFDLPQPNNPGLVTQVYYNPGRDQGEIWVWNCSTNANYGLRFTWYRPIQDFNSIDDTADIPREWASALQWNLAEELKLDYSVPPQRAAEITRKAAQKFELVSGWDRESTSVYFGRSPRQSR